MIARHDGGDDAQPTPFTRPAHEESASFYASCLVGGGYLFEKSDEDRICFDLEAVSFEHIVHVGMFLQDDNLRAVMFAESNMLGTSHALYSANNKKST